MLTWLILAVVCGLIGLSVGAVKHKATAGFWLGFCLLLIGVVVVFFLDGRPMCPCCSTRMNFQASICPACGRSLAWSDGQATARPAGYDAEAAAEAERARLDPVPEAFGRATPATTARRPVDEAQAAAWLN